jgi:hypothetical protein
MLPYNGSEVAACCLRGREAELVSRRLDESLSELLVCNVAVFDIPNRNRKETMAARAYHFEVVFLMIKFFGPVWDSRDNHDPRTVLLVATSARS